MGIVNPKKYEKVCRVKKDLHEYAKSIEHTGLLTLYSKVVTVKYFYIKGIPMLHEVRKNDRRDDALFQYGRTAESRDILRLSKKHLDFLFAEGYHNEREYNLTVKFIELQHRIEKLKYLKMKKMLGEFQNALIIKSKMYKRTEVLRRCEEYEKNEK
jgi:hypothetical protein